MNTVVYQKIYSYSQAPDFPEVEVPKVYICESKSEALDYIMKIFHKRLSVLQNTNSTVDHFKLIEDIQSQYSSEYAEIKYMGYYGYNDTILPPIFCKEIFRIVKSQEVVRNHNNQVIIKRKK